MKSADGGVESFCKSFTPEREKFAVYAGDGVYLSGVNTYQKNKFVHFGGLGDAVSMARAEAVAACNMARRAGIPAWIVRNPVGALA